MSRVRLAADAARVAIAVTGAAALAAGNPAAALKALLVLVPALGARWARPPAALELAFVLALAVEGAGTALGIYEVVPRWDDGAHLILPLLAGPVLFTALVRLGAVVAPAGRSRRALAGAWVVTAGAVLALGAAWELVEAAADAWFGTTYAGGYADTVDDLLDDAVAALASGLLWALWLRRGSGARSAGVVSAPRVAPPPSGARRQSVAVVVCTATHERAPLLHECVASVLAGDRRPDELLVVVDQNPSLKAELETTLPAAVRILATVRQGNSEGRNTGLRAATSEVVAFVDDDAAVEPGWLDALMAPFEGPGEVLGAGGTVVPRWQGGRGWLPDELLWMVGCTYRGHRPDPGPIRNPIGCNMAFRRAELTAVGAFATEFGKRGDALAICDETELSLRLASAYGPGRIHYAPAARVHHVIPQVRVSWRVLYRRCLMEGLSKGRLHRIYPGAALDNERGYVLALVARSVPALLLAGVVRRDPQPARGAAAIVLSLAVTAVAFLAGLGQSAREAAR